MRHSPFQKVKKNTVWGSYIDWDNRQFSVDRAQFFLGGM